MNKMDKKLINIQQNAIPEFIRFELKASRCRLSGYVAVQIEAMQGRKRRHYETGVLVKPEEWDEDRCIIRCSSIKSQMNFILNECKAQYEHTQIELWKRGAPISFETLELELRGGTDFIRYMSDAITSGDIAESTKKNRMTTVSLLKKYDNSLRICSITRQWLENFQSWLSEQSLSINTIAKHLSHIKIYVCQALREYENRNRPNPFADFQIRHIPYSHTSLSLAELKSIELYASSIRRQGNTASHCIDAFLFCCYTGLRYSDFVRLNNNNIYKEGDLFWLSFTSKKTKTEVRIPISLLFGGKAMELHKAYRDNNIDFYHLPSNQLTDAYLLQVAGKIGIKTHISFHTARHSNATLLIYKGVRIQTIGKLLGHKRIRTTEGYCDITKETIIKELEGLG